MATKKLIRITTVPISLDKLLSGQLAFMNQFYSVIGISSEKEYLEKIAIKEGIKVHAVTMTRQITPIKDIISVLKLYFFFKKEKPFIVHTHTPKAGIVGMMAARLAGVPHRLHTIAGLPLLEASGNKRKLLNFVEKMTYSCATKIYPNSFGLKEIIIEQKFCKLEKLKVLGNGSSNGIDTSHFDISHYSESQNQQLKLDLGISSTDFVFVFVGRLVKDKGINELVAAFENIQKQHVEVKLLLVGNYENDLDPLDMETLRCINNNIGIISTGYQKDVRPYFAIANALVFPSYREGFPNVVMQAGAMGLPSIVTDINGCNEIIEVKKNGLIIPVKNETAIFEAMLIMIQNHKEMEVMKSNARPMIVSRYGQKIVWEAILNEYKSLEQNV